MSGRPLMARSATALLCCVFFVSGAAALLFETLWFRLAALALGNSVHAGAVVLGSFMAGLALGNALAARHAHRGTRPLVAYAWIELAIAGSGTALVLGLPALSEWLVPLFRAAGEWPWAVHPLRLTIAFALLLVPTTAMGLTLPLLVRVLFAHDPRFGKALGALYGWNTLGAVAGALAGEIVLVARLGVRGSGYVAAALDVVAALAALALARRLGNDRPDSESARPRLSARAWRLLAATCVAGGVLLAFEVIWFRFLQLFVIGTSLTFALMLATVLAGIGAGGLAGSWWLRRPRSSSGPAAIALAAGCAAVWTYRLFPAPETTLGGTLGDAAGLASIAVALMLPTSLLSGILFTWIGEELQSEVGRATRAAGWATLANTVGATAGSLLAAFVLLPRAGVEVSFFLLALGYGLVAIAVLPRRITPVAALAGLFALSLVLFPFGAMAAHLDAASRVYRERFSATTVAIREGLTETIQYLRRDFGGEPLDYRLLTNAHSMSGTALDSKRYMRMYVHWPAAVHPGMKSALQIGFGVGTTAKALAETRELETIDIVDLSRDILDLSEVVFPDRQDNPLADPRVHVHVEDGRFFLLTADRQYDLITSEPPPLSVAGAEYLYSEEYFRLLRRCLAPGGYTTYWLPVTQVHAPAARSILRAFCNAFDDCSLWAGAKYDLMLVGSRDAAGSVDPRRFALQWADPVVALRLAEIGLERPEQLGATFVADAERLREIASDALPLTDDRPKRLVLGAATPADQSEYDRWLDLRAVVPHFRDSPLIRDRWPAAVREATYPYFRFQPIANMVVYPDDPQVLRMLEVILEQTPLRTAALWLAGSSVAHEQIAKRRHAEGRGGEYDHHLGAAALADRDYEAAAAIFGRRPRTYPMLADQLLVLSLCKAGDVEGARDAAERFVKEHGRAVGYKCEPGGAERRH